MHIISHRYKKLDRWTIKHYRLYFMVKDNEGAFRFFKAIKNLKTGKIAYFTVGGASNFFYASKPFSLKEKIDYSPREALTHRRELVIWRPTIFNNEEDALKAFMRQGWLDCPIKISIPPNGFLCYTKSRAEVIKTTFYRFELFFPSQIKVDVEPKVIPF